MTGFLPHSAKLCFSKFSTTVCNYASKIQAFMVVIPHHIIGAFAIAGLSPKLQLEKKQNKQPVSCHGIQGNVAGKHQEKQNKTLFPLPASVPGLVWWYLHTTAKSYFNLLWICGQSRRVCCAPTCKEGTKRFLLFRVFTHYFFFF